MPEPVVIIGAFHEIVDLVRECGHEIVGLVDTPGEAGDFPYPLIGDDATVLANPGLLAGAALVLTPDSPSVRRRLYSAYADCGSRFVSLVSPGAKVSESSHLGHGVVVQWGGHVSAQCRIGTGVRLNVNANVMHDVVIGDFTTVGPNAVVLGRVIIGTGCYIGGNSTLLPGLKIGDGAVIGAGTVVTKDVPAATVMVGNPGHPIRKAGIGRDAGDLVQ